AANLCFQFRKQRWNDPRRVDTFYRTAPHLEASEDHAPRKLTEISRSPLGSPLPPAASTFLVAHQYQAVVDVHRPPRAIPSNPIPSHPAPSYLMDRFNKPPSCFRFRHTRSS